MRRQLHGCQPSQVHQPKPLNLLIEADPFRRSEGPLAASSQMLREPTTNVPVDVSEGLAWIPKVEVVLPALQVPVQPPAHRSSAAPVCPLPYGWRDRPPGSDARQAPLHIRLVPAASATGAGSPDLAIPIRVAPLSYLCLSDRKSTRLNSSHLGISYAVFC